MHTIKRLFYLVIFVLASCSNNSDTTSLPSPTEFAPPVVMPLKFSSTKKIKWDSIKDIPVLPPVVKKLNLDKLPVANYDSLSLKPYTKPVEEAKFDYNALPQKDLDIDKLPSKPLKFKTYILSPPRLIKVGLPHLINGNDPSFFELGEAQGLPGQNITASIKDRQGFIWIANNQGLYRYDGENFLLYLNFDHHIINMIEDSSGRIWISKINYELDILDPQKGTLQKTDALNGLTNNYTRKMLQDNLGRVWVTLRSGGVNIIDLKTLSVKSLDIKQGLSDTKTYGIAPDTENKIWICTAAGVNVVDLNSHKIRYMDNTRGIVTTIFCDPNGKVWLGAYDGRINMLDLHKGIIQTIREAMYPNTEITSIIKDSEGKIWLSEFNRGIEILDPDKHIARYIHVSNSAFNWITNLFADNHNQVWITRSSSLNLIKQDRIITEHIGNDVINDLMEDKDGLIWKATTFNGIDIINHKKKTIGRLDHKKGLGNDSIIEVREINKRIFITSYDGLDIIDSTRKTITHLGRAQGIGNNMSSVEIDKKGRYWIGNFRGELAVYNPHNNTYKHIGKTEGLGGSNIMSIIHDLHGRIWISTYYGGINVLDPETMTIRYLNNEEGIKENDIKMFVADTSGNIWIGTPKGIYIADMDHQKLTSFSTSNGLIAKSIKSLLQYDGKIYAGTDQGINVIKPPASRDNRKKWEVESFGKAYGLIKLNAAGIYQADMISRDGYYWWAGEAGINVLDLSKKENIIPPLYIAGISIMGQPAYFTDKTGPNLKVADTLSQSDDIANNGGKTTGNGLGRQKALRFDKITGPYNIPVNLSLPYDANNIQFSFLSFYPGKHVPALYRYILTGADKQWSSATTEASSGNYLGLASGKYIFKVVSQGLNGAWSKPAEISFIIRPPWWKTWWAYILYVALFIVLMWSIIYLRSIKLIREKQVLEHKVHIRTEEVLQQKEEIEAQRDHLEKAFSDLKVTQSQLIQSEKMASLGELTAGIAHEIQNPLNFVNNFSEVNTELLIELKQEILAKNYEEVNAIADDIQQNEEKINHHGKRADAIVKGMLQHSQSSNGKKEPVDINALADEYLRLSYHGLRAKDKSFNAELVTHFDPELPKTNVIPQDIGRVLLNLFNNAFYSVNQKKKTACEEYKPEVSVSTGIEKGQVIIKVKDNGVGIPDAIKEKIMQPFFTTKPTGEGTGLGLSLSYDILVKGHDGTIVIDSREHEYTTFVISLPLK
jgi:signal transduction histidine kinase/ligand-binding sensor domain-containing protein